MSRKTALQAAPAPASKTSCEPDRQTPQRALCGSHIGDRRVRIERPPRTVAQKVASVVRRAFSR